MTVTDDKVGSVLSTVYEYLHWCGNPAAKVTLERHLGMYLVGKYEYTAKINEIKNTSDFHAIATAAGVNGRHEVATFISQCRTLSISSTNTDPKTRTYTLNLGNVQSLVVELNNTEFKRYCVSRSTDHRAGWEEGPVGRGVSPAHAAG